MSNNADQPGNAAPSPPPAAAKSPRQDGVGDASLSQIIDTIEAIIIALIVALTFRAFIVEAFVIPTGSMAPTLLGAHYKVTCPECGCTFDLEADLSYQVAMVNGARTIPGGRELRPELRSNSGVPLDGHMVPVLCPNCRYAISPKELPQYLKLESETPVVDGRVGNAPRLVPFAWANNGDRILVLKYLYSIMEPNRWDVIVFKEPQHTQDNYIKRLAGLPGDTLEIIDGDVYIWPREARDQKDASKFQIARKPETIQNALWQLVYDNDCYPQDAGSKQRGDPNRSGPQRAVFNSPWEGDANWTHGPVMAYAGAGPSTLAFNITPPQARESPYTLNTLGFNNDYDDASSTSPRSYVGDLRLEAVWQPADAAGLSINMTLGRPSNCFRVAWAAKTGVRLERYNADKRVFEEVPGVTAAVVPEAGKSYHLAMNNVDRAVQFSIDGKEVITYAEPWTEAQAKDSELKYPSLFDANLGMPTGSPDTMIRIDVGGKCSMAHLKLFRDLYYTQIYMQGDNPPTGTEGHAITLNDDEFFALGDNSRRSSDSRFWSTTFDAGGDLGLRNGVVPRRYLLGKAFFVYWPAGWRPSESVPLFKELPLVPNTGDMRVIR